MLKVFLTVDTEVWPVASNWPHTPLAAFQSCDREIQCYFWGGEQEPRFGLQFQLKTLQQHGLKATFFVDPLFSIALGKHRLHEVVGPILGAGQEVALHLHPEWLNDPRMPRGLPPFRGPLMSSYSEPEQATLLANGLDLLQEAGAPRPTAFRAGSFGAGMSTFRALQAAGIDIDSSLNACFPHSFADLVTRSQTFTQHTFEAVREFPVTTFLDGSRTGLRPLQIAACTVQEMTHALQEAFRKQWPSVVLVTHSFEFVRTDRLETTHARVGPRRALARRFERLCAFLARKRDRLVTSHFRDEAQESPGIGRSYDAIASSRLRTFSRYVAQAIAHFH